MEENKTTSSRAKIDALIWVGISILVASGVVANQYFGEIAWAIRFSGWIVLIIVLLGLAYLTSQGKGFWEFVQKAKIELYKVIWPSRDETIKTTAIVAALVFAMSIILWFVDSILLKIMGWITGG